VHAAHVPAVAARARRAQPGVTSTIIGARRLAQLEDNVKGVDVKLTTEELGRLDSLTKPALGFPQNMQPMFPAIHNGGTTVNGTYYYSCTSQADRGVLFTPVAATTALPPSSVGPALVPSPLR